MKVTVKQPEPVVKPTLPTLGSLTPGTVFRFPNALAPEYYIRVICAHGEPRITSAVSFSGCLYSWPLDRLVQPLVAVVTVQEV